MDLSVSVLPPGQKNTKKTSTTTKTHPTAGYEIKLDFGFFAENCCEQDWFQLLFMGATNESCTVNRTKVVEV